MVIAMRGRAPTAAEQTMAAQRPASPRGLAAWPARAGQLSVPAGAPPP
ncbi:MAG: hypothetical protein OZSIB_0138 [Candidatus Ozemobacter sibiricus]|uniref:Uncharacterized protein n=1 Tax=Candidatus Ozemobacter sibiricus TaxID=2268124 RepID=A0A367ZN29_9BACT|nr:MAG: hypothetical protein OZSIB_0138 [Candidatus Ozemobacter sibiricus]